MPDDPEGAIFAYNHADWYVADVLARAACFGGIGNGALGSLSLIPKHQQLACTPAEDTRRAIPEDYLKAFQDAAGRYELGEDGVWALAAVARLESDFGRGMTKDGAASCAGRSASPTRTGSSSRWTATATASRPARAPRTPPPRWRG